MNGQCGSFDQFLDDERAVGVLTAVEHGDDPRVAERVAAWASLSKRSAASGSSARWGAGV